jgi:hypothetical protein
MPNLDFISKRFFKPRDETHGKSKEPDKSINLIASTSLMSELRLMIFNAVKLISATVSGLL